MTSADILRQMINEATDQVANLTSNITQIGSQISSLQIEDDAIVDGVLNIVSSEVQTYLSDIKLPTFPVGSSVVIGPTYNVIGYTNQLTDWEIIDSTGDTIYQYGGIGWDGDTAIVDFLDEWDFGNDYLTRPLTSGASYGIRPYMANLNIANGILEENRDKVYDSISMFERFAS